MAFRIIIGAIIFSFFCSCDKTKKAVDLNKTISLQADSIRILKSKIDTLSEQNIAFRNQPNDWFSDKEINKLKRNGIHDPVKDIPGNLYSRPQLIPYPAVLGGTMRFWKISLLGDRWVRACFEDGHIGGEIILKFRVQKDSSLKWTVLDSYLE